jgi:hypothetical protein
MSGEQWWLSDHPDAPAHKAWLDEQRKERGESLSPTIPRRKPNPGYVTQAQLGDYMEHIGKTIAAELAKRDAEIAELRARPVGVDYKGVYRKGCSYSRNQAVSHQGSLWIAVKNYPEKEPGEPSSGWRLSVKKGRDGKDATK